MSRPLPAAFYARATLGHVNTLAVGLALASVVGALFAFVWHFALPTLLIGVVWAALLRWPRTVRSSSRLRVGWVLSIPLGALNASLIGALLWLTAQPGTTATDWLMAGLAGAVLGLSVGALVWVPAVAVTMLVFGLPIAWSQRLARRGLAGQERGEAIVGAVSAVLGLFAPLRMASGMFGTDSRAYDSIASAMVVAALGVLAVLLGVTALVVSTTRARRRSRFVASVERGERPGYRIDETTAGKVLVRVETHGEGYRVADFEEVLAELEWSGEARRALVPHARDSAT